MNSYTANTKGSWKCQAECRAYICTHFIATFFRFFGFLFVFFGFLFLVFARGLLFLVTPLNISFPLFIYVGKVKILIWHVHVNKDVSNIALLEWGLKREVVKEGRVHSLVQCIRCTVIMPSLSAPLSSDPQMDETDERSFPNRSNYIILLHFTFLTSSASLGVTGSPGTGSSLGVTGVPWTGSSFTEIGVLGGLKKGWKKLKYNHHGWSAVAYSFM